MVKIFDGKIKLLDYEVLGPQYDPVNLFRDHLKLGYAYRHVLDIANFWPRCLNEYQTQERFWSRLTIDEIKLYKKKFDVSDLADDGAYMHPTSYDNIKNTPIISTPLVDPVINTMEVLMLGIIKRREKWVEWT